MPEANATLVYYVATSLDGYIAHPDGSWGGIIETGTHVDDFTSMIAGAAAVLMGRHTYEVGLQHGLALGAAPYPGRPNYVVSSTLTLPIPPPSDDLRVIAKDPVAAIAGLKRELTGTIWLCGGGVLAGALLDAGLVDEVVIKLNPVLFGAGLPLSPGLSSPRDARLLTTTTHSSGVIVARYALGQEGRA